MSKRQTVAVFLLVVLGVISAVAVEEKKPVPGECVATNSLEAYLERNPPKDVLALADGTRIKTSEEWTAKVRPAVLKFFDEGVYSMMPPKPAKLDLRLVEFGYAFDGATRRTIPAGVSSICLRRLPSGWRIRRGGAVSSHGQRRGLP